MKKLIKSLLFVGLFLSPMFATTEGRFRDNNNGTITDTQSGLMWQQDANESGEIGWHEAHTYCSDLRLAGFSDWRLPTIDELKNIISVGEYNQDKWLQSQGFKILYGKIFGQAQKILSIQVRCFI